MQEKQEIHPPITLFLSYAQEDETWLRKLESHLSLLKRQDLISTWHNQLILAGSNQAQEIEKQLNMASIILLLISSDFLASDYCYGIEMQRALERAERNEAYVIPILLRPVDWDEAPFQHLPCLPGKSQPVTAWPDQDEAFRTIAVGIRAAAKQVRNAVSRHHLLPLNLHTIAIISNQPEITLEEAETAYRKQVVEAYHSLSFSGFEQIDHFLDDVPLESIFVRLSLTIEHTHREREASGTDRQSEGRGVGYPDRIIKVQQPITLAQALNKPMLLVGDPGAGKSTLLRWLAVTFAQDRQAEPDRVGSEAAESRLPLLVELGHLPDRYLTDEGWEVPNWLTVLPTLVTAQPLFHQIPPALLQQALTAGRCLILFDGLDEVASRPVRMRLAHSLLDLQRLAPGNQIVIGGRPAGVRESETILRPTFQRCEIQPFTPEELHRFFRFWYTLDRQLSANEQRQAADALYQAVQATPGTMRLATTPLLATTFLLLWRNEQALPERRVDLYERCCRVLLEQWEHAHDVRLQGILANLGWERHVRLLAPVAYFIHQQEQRVDISEEDLLPVLTQGLLDIRVCSDETSARKEAEHLLELLALRSTLLQYRGIERGKKRYGFPHLTFQEYLAARFIAAQPDPISINLVMEHLHETWWQEVHLLTIAYLGSGPLYAQRASVLLQAIMQRYRPPWWLLRSSQFRWIRLVGPGKWLPGFQLERRVAWLLQREEQFAFLGAAECSPDGLLPELWPVLKRRLARFVGRTIILDQYGYWPLMRDWLTAARQRLPRQLREGAVPPLVVALQNPNSHVRGPAAACLGILGVVNEMVIQALREALPNELQAGYSLIQLAEEDEKALQVLLQALQDPDPVVRFSATAGMRLFKGENETVVQVLLEALQDPYEGIRQYAAESLGELGGRSKAVLRALLKALQDSDKDVRAQAAESLGKVGGKDGVVLRALLKALQDPYERVRAFAAGSLGQLGDESKAVIGALLKALQNSDSFVRSQAAESLGKVGGKDGTVVQALLKALDDSDPFVRVRAAGSLGRLGKEREAAIQVLLTALDDPNDYVGEEVVELVEKLGERNETVIEAFLKALLRPRYWSYWRPAEKIWQYLIKPGERTETVIQLLLKALDDPDGDVRRNAAESLGHLGRGDAAVTQALLRALDDPDKNVRGMATKSLGHLGGEDAAVTQALLKALDDPDKNVRGYAVGSLGGMEIKESALLYRTLVALNHRAYAWHLYERWEALEAIRRLLDGRSFPGL